MAPTLLFFIRLKQMAHGTGSVSLSSGDFEMTIPSDHLLSFAFDGAASWAEKPLTILNAPAKFVELFVSLLVAQKAKWYPASLLSYTWHALIYPIYALPAWLYVGMGIDAGMGRRLVRGWNAVLSVFLTLTFAVLFYGLRFSIPVAEREVQEPGNWIIDGLALWALLFAIPFAAWMLQRRRQTRLLSDEVIPS